MVWPNRMSALVITLVLLFLYPAVARADVPVSYITELIDAGYNTDGSLQSPVTKIGYVEVEIPNQQDVLQYIILNTSGTADTNLQSVTSYRGAAASPSPGGRTRMYLNTTTGESNISYELTGSVPMLYLGLEYANDAGGHDIYSGGTNYLTFNLTINSTHDLNGVKIYARFARNTLGTADAMHVYYTYATSTGQGFNAQAQDSDSDGYFDMVYWTGDLSAGTDVRIDFKSETTPGVNFDESLMYVDLDQGVTSHGIYQDDTQTFTGTTFADRFSRGPIREGVIIMIMSNWATRGFITNMATGLDYRIHSWELYEAGNPSPLIYSSQEIYPFSPGSTEYTDWYDTGIPGSQSSVGYYSVAWDWEVGWGSSHYASTSQAAITMPMLYEIDPWMDKSVFVSSNTESGTSLSVQDLAKHLGHSSLEVNQVTISSVLPRLSSGGATNTWNPSNVRVYFMNASDRIDITSYASISTQAAGATDGFVDMSISDLASVIGRGLRQNEDIRVEYTLSGSSYSSTQTYQFCHTSTLTTLSGTPVTENMCEDIVIPGVGGEEPPSPGGGGGAVIQPALYADIVREVGEGYFTTDNIVHVIGKYNIMDTGNKGLKEIKTLIYIPKHGRFDPSSLSFRIYDASAKSWDEWTQNTDYVLTDNGIKTFEGEQYREYLISRRPTGDLYDEGMQLFNGDRIEIDYMTTVPVGTSSLVMRVSGYNYYIDAYIFEDLHVPVRREGQIQEPVVSDSSWQTEKIYAGTPVRWIKTLDVHNPNSVPIEYVKSFEVFPDSMGAYLLQIDEDKETLDLKEGGTTYVDIMFRLAPGETRTYVLEVTTPPVLEVERTVDVIESSESEIKFMVNITLENFALERYPGVSLLFKTEPERVISVMEGWNRMNYSGFDSSTTEIFLGDMSPGQKKHISILYSQIPPILMTAMSSGMYSCSDSARMTVFLVPSEREATSYLEFEVVGPEPHMNTLSAQLVELRELWPWEEIEVPITVDISTFPDGRYYVYTYFKKNFQTVLSDQQEFVVSCPERVIVSISWVGFMGIAIAIIIYLVIRTWRKKRSGELDEIKSKLRKLR